MPIHSDRGKKDRGERVPLTNRDGSPVLETENGKPVALYLRTLNDDVIKDIEKDFPQKRKWVNTPQGKQRVKYRSEEAEAEIWKRKICYVFSDTENYLIAVEAEDALAFYQKELNDDKLKLKKSICLDGKWTDPLRRRILDRHRPLYSFIMWWMGEEYTKYRKDEDEDVENL